MQNILDWLDGKKTYLVCALVIAGAWGAYFQGAADLQHTIDATEAALAGMTMRAAVAKSGPQT